MSDSRLSGRAALSASSLAAFGVLSLVSAAAGQNPNLCGILGEAARDEAENAAQPDSLLSDIARTQPWLRNRVRGLRIGYTQLRDSITALGSELDGQAGETVDFTDIRQRLAWVLAGLRHQQARESDLIYEAYYDAFRTDLASEAAGPPGR